MTAKQQLYVFCEKQVDGDASLANTLGGKGANLAEMKKLGLPVPPGLTVPTTFMTTSVEKCGVIADAVEKYFQVFIVPEIGYLPLVSVRSGSRVSMPGMMDTVLNVGLTTETLPEWKARLGEIPALDSYRRLIQMFGETVCGIPREKFLERIEYVKKYKYGAPKLPTCEKEFSVKHWEVLIDTFKSLIVKTKGKAFPDSRAEQLKEAILCVFKSWNSERAKEYRKLNGYPDDWGTAVTIQSMVFGNMNDKSASGVLFSRNPKTGDNEVFGEFLPNAQGEDVVAGTHTPYTLSQMLEWNSMVYKDLLYLVGKLETHYKDMQDVEFTVQDGKLWLLQTRSGKRSAQAAFKVAYDMKNEGILTASEALRRVNGKQYLKLTMDQVDPLFKDAPIVVGIPAAGAMATGVVALTKEEAIKMADAGQAVILVRDETTPDDFPGMVKSVGILTTTGGVTSHAAVVARGMDKACVVGCSTLAISKMLVSGETITIDGKTGRVWKGKVPVIKGSVPEFVADMIKWGSKNLRTKKKPVQPYVDSIPEEGETWLDMTGLSEKYEIQGVLETLLPRKQLGGILDFVEDVAIDFSEDEFFMNALKLGNGKITKKQPKEKDKYNVVVTLLKFSKWTQEMLSRWAVNIDTTRLSAQQIQELKDRGWRLVYRPTTLAAMMRVKNGYVVRSTGLVAKLEEEGLPYEEALAILNEAGRKVATMPKAVAEEELAFEVFGNDC